MYLTHNWGKAWQALPLSLVPTVFKPRTHKLYILRHYTNIVYLLCAKIKEKINC
jgi:hypothetical protein